MPKGKSEYLRKTSHLAINEAKRLGLNPIEMLAEVYQLAIDGYKKDRGITDKSDSGAQWLSVARAAADSLASYVHPKLSAIAVHELISLEQQNKSKVMTTEEAVTVIMQDPFLKSKVHDSDIVEQMTKAREKPLLPVGEKNE